MLILRSFLWNCLYTDGVRTRYIQTSGAISVGLRIDVGGDVYSRYDCKHDLGKYNCRWRNVYASSLILSSEASVDGLFSNASTITYGGQDSDNTISLGGVVYGNSSGYAYDIACGVCGKASNSSGDSDYTVYNYGVYGEAKYGDYNYGVYGYAPYSGNSYAIYAQGSAGGTSGWSSSSDSRLKKDVKTISGALDKVLKLRGVTYYWKNREEMAAAKGVSADKMNYGYDDKKHIGVIAQEIEAEYPELVHTDSDGFKSVDYSAITPILIEAMKELKAEKDELKAEKDALEAKVEKLEAQMQQILDKLGK